MTATANKPARKSRKPERSLSFVGDVLTITLTHSATRKEVDTYAVEPIPADLGRGFRLTRTTEGQEQAAYDVLLCGSASTCECKGYLHHGRCKHLDALALLDGLGRLPLPGQAPPAPVAPSAEAVPALALRCAVVAA